MIKTLRRAKIILVINQNEYKDEKIYAHLAREKSFDKIVIKVEKHKHHHRD